MKCSEFDNQVQDWLDGELSADRAAALQAHAEACPDCRARVEEFRTLRAALAEMPAPALSGERTERLLRASRPRRRTMQPALAAAATFALAALILPFADWDRTGPATGETAATAEVSVPVNQLRTVRLALSSQRTLDDATVMIELPPGVELQGRPAQRVLRWQTDISAGNNQLSLPLIAHEPGTGELVARIEHDGKSREMRLRLDARETGETSPTRGGLRLGPAHGRA